jgi:hypothetical protein
MMAQEIIHKLHVPCLRSARVGPVHPFAEKVLDEGRVDVDRLLRQPSFVAQEIQVELFDRGNGRGIVPFWWWRYFSFIAKMSEKKPQGGPFQRYLVLRTLGHALEKRSHMGLV